MSDAKTSEGRKKYSEHLAAMDDTRLAADLRDMDYVPRDFHDWAIDMAKAEIERRKLAAARADGVALARLVEAKLGWVWPEGMTRAYDSRVVPVDPGAVLDVLQAGRAILAKVEGE